MSRNIRNLILCLSTILFFSTAYSNDWIWIHADGSGWGSPESSACRDAERDADMGLDRECRWQANGHSYFVHFPNYSRCNCYESGNDYFRCSTRGDAQCEVWD
jgi:hypothetical protein